MRYVLAVGVWELVRPLLRHGFTLAARWFWAYEVRREMRVSAKQHIEGAI